MAEKIEHRSGDPFSYAFKFPYGENLTGFMRIIPRDSSKTAIEIEGEKSADQWVFAEGDTSNWNPGTYTYVIYFKKDGSVIKTAADGEFSVLQNLISAAPGFDPRSRYEKELDKALDLLSNWDSSGKVHRYKIGDREIEYGSQTELISKIRFLRAMVAKEKGLRLAMPKSMYVTARAPL